MKKDTKSVWILKNGDTILGCNYHWKTGNAYTFFVQTTDIIMTYNKEEMAEIYNLTATQFANIKRNQF